MSVFEHDITIRLGEPFGPHTLVIRDADGDPVDISAATLTLKLYELDGASDLTTKALSPTGQPGEAALALTLGEVNDLAAHVEDVLRFKVVDGTGAQKAGGWAFIAPERGAV